MAYAKSKKALGICDRCGFTYKLRELIYEVEDETRNGLRVCKSCLAPDHPTQWLYLILDQIVEKKILLNTLVLNQ